MTRVDFYLLPHADEASRWQFTCRLAEKAWRLGNRILIHVATPAAAAEMDRQLWCWRADSFVPHAVLPAGASTPIHIGCDPQESGAHHDLLVNLGETIPGFFSRFERVAEIVTQDPQQRAASRERYRFYKERGYELNLHDLAARA